MWIPKEIKTGRDVGAAKGKISEQQGGLLLYEKKKHAAENCVCLLKEGFSHKVERLACICYICCILHYFQIKRQP